MSRLVSAVANSSAAGFALQSVTKISVINSLHICDKAYCTAGLPFGLNFYFNSLISPPLIRAVAYCMAGLTSAPRCLVSLSDASPLSRSTCRARVGRSLLVIVLRQIER